MTLSFGGNVVQLQVLRHQHYLLCCVCFWRYLLPSFWPTPGRYGLAQWSLSCRAESVPVRQPLLCQTTTVETASPLPPLSDWNDQRQWVTARWCEKPLMEDRQTAVQSFHLILMKWLRLTEWFTSSNLKATQLNFLEKDHCCNVSSGLQMLRLGSRPKASVFRQSEDESQQSAIILQEVTFVVLSTESLAGCRLWGRHWWLIKTGKTE